MLEGSREGAGVGAGPRRPGRLRERHGRFSRRRHFVGGGGGAAGSTHQRPHADRFGKARERLLSRRRRVVKRGRHRACYRSRYKWVDFARDLVHLVVAQGRRAILRKPGNGRVEDRERRACQSVERERQDDQPAHGQRSEGLLRHWMWTPFGSPMAWPYLHCTGMGGWKQIPKRAICPGKPEATTGSRR